MKQLTAFLSFLVLGFSAKAATIHGSFSDVKPTEVSLYRIENASKILVETQKLTENQSFSFSFSAKNPALYLLDYHKGTYNTKIIRLWMDDQQDLSLAIQKNDFSISGKNIENQLKLKEIGDAYAQFFKNASLPYSEYLSYLQKEGIPTWQKLQKSFQSKDAAFSKMAKVLIETDFRNALVYSYRAIKREFAPQEAAPAFISEILNDSFFDTKNLENAPNIDELIENYQYFKINTKAIAYDDYSNWITSKLKNPLLLDIYYRQEMKRYKRNETEFRAFLNKNERFLLSETSKNIVKDVLDNFEKQKNLLKNVPTEKAFAFSYKDTNGKTWTLDDFKGKFLYIDLWATWCGPCIAEIPSMKKLFEKVDKSKINFLSISLDKPEDTQKWKDFVAKKNLPWAQLIADKEFKSDMAIHYNIKSIPRFLLIDPNGNIISNDATRASNPMIYDILNDLFTKK